MEESLLIKELEKIASEAGTISRRAINLIDTITYGEPDNPKPPASTEQEEDILAHWNSKDIIQHTGKSIIKAVTAALKKHGKEDIMTAINNYATVYYDESYYFNHRWRLDKFVKQENALPDFLSEGQKWLTYQDFIKERKQRQGDVEDFWKRNVTDERLSQEVEEQQVDNESIAKYEAMRDKLLKR